MQGDIETAQEFTNRIVKMEAEERKKYYLNPGDIFRSIVQAYDDRIKESTLSVDEFKSWGFRGKDGLQRI